MRIVVLFDSKGPELGLFYGYCIRDLILKTQVLQRSKRRLNIAIGDIGIFSEARTWDEFDALSEATYFASDTPHLFADRVRATYRLTTVYAWRIDGIDEVTALALHEVLSETSNSYLGFHMVDVEIMTHRRFYMAQLQLWCRIHGRTSVLLTDFGEEASESWYERGALRQLGFARVRRRISGEWWYATLQR